MLKYILELTGMGVRKRRRLAEKIGIYSIKSAMAVNGLKDLVSRLREIQPDISCQEESCKNEFNDYSEIKRRALHAFQCKLMLRALEHFPDKKLTIVDIGDSAGTHMSYLNALTKDKREINSISVNLDERAVKKIRSRGFTAVLCRAEELDLKEDADLFVTFEMVEHLHNPSFFFRRLAKQNACNRLVMTVPFMKNSRVGLHNIRAKTGKEIFAEEEHIFELSPQDWTLLILHSGWRVAESLVYYQYPRGRPLVSRLLALFWRRIDFEGFWGAILEKDTSVSDLYQDWGGCKT